MKYLLCFLIAFVMTLPGVFARQITASEPGQIDETYSFENDFEGWIMKGSHINPDLPQPITLSQTRAADGVTSLQFDFNRDAFGQFLWIEKVFSVEPGQVYDINIDYALGTRDCCSNPFALLTGALRNTPVTLQDMNPAYQGIVDNGENTFSDYKWVDKQYAITTRSDEQGKFHLLIGFFGNFEVRRIEYIDRVHVKIARRTEQPEFYSFENDFEGWEPRAIDLNAGAGSLQDWSIAPSSQSARDGNNSLRFLSTNSAASAKAFIIKPFAVQRKQTYQVKVEYEFLNGSQTSGARIITGALRARPETEEDLISVYQEKAKKPEVYGWQPKQYEFKIRSKKSEVVYVVIGIAANNPGHHLYYLDNVCVTLQKQ
jgi:hypothetical protein